MNHPSALPASLLLCVAATAQVTMQPVLVTPHATAAIAGISTHSVTSVFPNDAISAAAGLGDVATFLQCTSLQHPTQVSYATTHQIAIAPNAANPALGVCDVDVRLGLVATTPTAVRIEIEATFFAPTGGPQPTLRVDLGDDGAVEFTGLVAQTFFTLLPVGTTAIRFKALTAASLPGNTTMNLSMRVTPAHTSVSPQVVGCDPGGVDTLHAVPEFDGTVSFVATPILFDPVVLVLGLNAAPILLPSVGAQPCILWPAADILVVMPTPSGSWPNYRLPLPPALRPVTFRAQGVRVTASGLQTTNAVLVGAN